MKKPLLIFFLAALVVAAFLSPFASSNPDGLDRVSQDLGFEERSEGKEPFEALIPDYKFPGIGNESVATSLAGVLGTLITFGVAYGVGKAVAKRNKTMV
jgi:cobalt/nickel transport protein